MTPVVTAEEKDMIRIKTDGASATLRLQGDQARLLFLQMPEKELIRAAEAEAAASGATRLCLDIVDREKNYSPLLEAEGFALSNAGTMLSLRTEELLASDGVKKSLRMKFPDIRTNRLENLLLYEWDDVTDFLNKFHYDIQTENYEHFEQALSSIAYDKDYHPRAALLSTIQKEGIVIELLLGFSSKKPQYILCVCQEFAHALWDRIDEKRCETIYLYSCTDYVLPLVRRLLDSKYELSTEYEVLHGEKILSTEASRIRRESGKEEGVLLWKKEAEAVFGQRNISEKAVWLDNRR